MTNIKDEWNDLEQAINKTFIIPKDYPGHTDEYIGFGEHTEYSIEELREIKRIIDNVIELKTYGVINDN